MIYDCPRTLKYMPEISVMRQRVIDRVNPHFEDSLSHIYHFVPHIQLSCTNFLTHFPHPFIHSVTFD